MAKKLFIGTLKHLQFARMPAQGLTVGNESYLAVMKFQGGGAAGVRSAQRRKTFNLSFAGPVKDLDGIGYYNRLATGFHGGGLVYLNNPYDHETNLAAPAWASPGMAEEGWHKLLPPTVATVAYTDTPANTFNQPDRQATYTFTNGGVGAPAEQRHRHVIVIPPTHTLWLGATGAATGTGAVYVRPIAVGDGLGFAAPVTLTPSVATSATRLTNSFSGAQYKAVEVYLGRSGTAAGSVTLTSLMAQLWTSDSTPATTGPHVEGNGHTGCMFEDDAVVEDYPYMYPPRKGLSTKLGEVGAWQRS